MQIITKKNNQVVVVVPVEPVLLVEPVDPVELVDPVEPVDPVVPLVLPLVDPLVVPLVEPPVPLVEPVEPVLPVVPEVLPEVLLVLPVVEPLSGSSLFLSQAMIIRESAQKNIPPFNTFKNLFVFILSSFFFSE